MVADIVPRGHMGWAKKCGCNEEEIEELMKFNFGILKPMKMWL